MFPVWGHVAENGEHQCQHCWKKYLLFNLGHIKPGPKGSLCKVLVSFAAKQADVRILVTFFLFFTRTTVFCIKGTLVIVSYETRSVSSTQWHAQETRISFFWMQSKLVAHVEYVRAYCMQTICYMWWPLDEDNIWRSVFIKQYTESQSVQLRCSVFNKFMQEIAGNLYANLSCANIVLTKECVANKYMITVFCTGDHQGSGIVFGLNCNHFCMKNSKNYFLRNVTVSIRLGPAKWITCNTWQDNVLLFCNVKKI